jgi:lauroyl/myristoyl acyltransferase
VVGVRLLHGLVPLIPRESLVALARGLGHLGFVFLLHDRKVALANLDLAYGETLTPRAKRRIARRAFQTFVLSALEIFWSRRITKRVLDGIVEIDPGDVKRTFDLIAKGRGLIGITSHLGSWEILHVLAASLGMDMATLARRLRNDELNDLVTSSRRQHGEGVILHDDAARGIFRALRRKQAVAIPLDQNTRPDRGGCYVRFFGVPVAASRAVATFAFRTGAPVVSATCFPLRGGRYRVEWGPEIVPPPEGTPDRERVFTQACMDFIEKQVRRRPDAWLWMYRRWKYRPTEEATGFPYYSKVAPEPESEKSEARSQKPEARGSAL